MTRTLTLNIFNYIDSQRNEDIDILEVTNRFHASLSILFSFDMKLRRSKAKRANYSSECYF